MLIVIAVLLGGCTPPRRAEPPPPAVDPSRLDHAKHAQVACISCHRTKQPGADDHKPCDDSGCHKTEFTVLPGKIKRALPDSLLPRYIILGNYDKIFETATTFREAGSGIEPGGTSAGIVQTTLFPVSPEAGAIINSRLPEISADLSTVENLDPATLSMKVSGFGEVPAVFVAETKKFSWQVNRRLRQTSCQVAITWKDTTGKAPEAPLRWSFQIDLESAYLPEGE